MNRRQIRYLLARIRSQATGVCEDVPEMPEGFKETFESQDAFRGWIAYTVTWDVDETDPWKVVTLKKSLEDEWQEKLNEVVPELPLELLEE
jgi:hypothetical protein